MITLVTQVAARPSIGLLMLALVVTLGQSKDGVAGHAASPMASGADVAQVAGGWRVADQLPGVVGFGIDMLSQNEGWAVGVRGEGLDLEGVILHYVDETWTVFETLPGELLFTIHMLSPSDGWVLGYRPGGALGRIYRFQDGEWRRTWEQSFMVFNDIHMLPSGEGWIVGGRVEGLTVHPLTLRYDGAAWRDEPQPGNTALVGVAQVGDGEGWAVGKGGSIVRLREGAWTPWPTALSHDLNDIDMRSPKEGWIVGNGSMVLRYDGEEWDEDTAGVPPGLLLVDVTAGPSGAWLVGCEAPCNGDGAPARILRREDGGWTPSRHEAEDDAFYLDVLPGGEAWAIGSAGTILRHPAPEEGGEPTPPATAEPTPTIPLPERVYLPFAMH